MTKTKVAIIAAFLAALVILAVCVPSDAEAVTMRHKPKDFKERMNLVDRQPHRGGLCWRFREEIRITNVIGKLAYYPQFAIMVCSNRRVTRITSVPEYFCNSLGGYYSFKGCKRERGKVGYKSLAILVKWDYFFGVGPVGTNRTPSVDARINPHKDGTATIRGTWWYR